MTRRYAATILMACALCLLPLTGAAAGSARQVADLETTGRLIPWPSPIIPPDGFGVYGSQPSQFLELDGKLLFAADDTEHGSELWLSDGTREGTVRITDICPGECGAVPRILGKVGGLVVFWAQDGERRHLWSTDGTAEGTRLVSDVACPGSCEPVRTSRFVREIPPLEAAEVDGRLVFEAAAHGADREPWVSDGTPAGTRELADLCPGSCEARPRSFFAFDGRAYFVANDGEIAWELRRTDGVGIETVDDFCTGEGTLSIRDYAVLDGTLYALGICGSSLAADDGFFLQVSDEHLLGLRLPRSDRHGFAAFPDHLVRAGERLVFVVEWLAQAAELWASDGTFGGTGSLLELSGRASDGVPAVLGDRAYVPAGQDVWVTDGTAAGTHLAFETDAPLAVKLTAIDERLLLSGELRDGERGLWLSDGTAEGTVLIEEDIFSGRGIDSVPEFFALGDDVFFPGFEDPTERFEGYEERDVELWALERNALSCPAAAHCLQDGRFAVTVEWRDPRSGDTGVGRPVPGTDRSGYFWFFDPDNLELVVKVLDARPVNGHFWVFHGGITDVEYRLTVRDRLTGAERTYEKEAGDLCGGSDVRAFAGEGGPGGMAGAGLLATARDSAGEAAETAPECPDDGETLCLGTDGRFRVRVDWRDPRSGDVGVGHPIPARRDSGSFWFFAEDNLELVVKVLDARSINGHFWVLWGGLTDVEYTIRVEDTASGDEATFEHPAGDVCGGADLRAL